MPTTFSLAEREREYSPSSCIGGNYQPCLQEYADRSAATPAACTVHRDLAYGEKLSERLDLFLPTSTAAASQPVALLVFIHGGYLARVVQGQLLVCCRRLYRSRRCLCRD